MAGFIRRYGYFPGTEVITQIEGTVIVDLPPPGAVEGVGTGTVAVVGEFADCTYAVQYGTSGDISAKLRPVEAFSTQDMLNKVGGFDETLGDFGNSLGNGFAALRNKRFSRLVLMPVNLASAQGARFVRELPLCTAPTNTLPVVPVSGATISAGREFRDGVGRIRIAQTVQFTARNYIDAGVGGSIANAGAPAVTQPFTAAPGFDWLAIERPDGSLGAKKGDILVIGNNNAGALQPLPAGGNLGAGTYRVAADPMAVPASSATFTGAVFVASGFAGGETIGVAVDGGASVPVVFGIGDQSPAQVAAAINTAVGITLVTVAGGALVFTSPTTGVLSEVDVPVTGALTSIGLTGGFDVFGSAAASNVIDVEKLDGTSFDFVTVAGTVPWRLHFSTDADSAPERVIGSSVAGGYAALEAGGYVVAVRPLTNTAGAQVTGTYPAGTAISPAVVPTALTGSTADPLSGLSGLLHPLVATAFTAAVQGINPVSSASIDALYESAIDALVSEDDPARDINIVVAARKSAAIRTKLKAHVLQASEVGLGRTTVISPELSVQDLTTVVSAPDPGVGANRDERVIYSWPGARQSVPEAVSYLIATAIGTTTSDGILDDTFDHWYASLLSNLAPERNPGQAAQPVPTVFAPVLGTQRGVSNLGLAEYTALRRAGVSGLRIDRTVGPIIQSGITTSLTSGQKNVSRRRMADFIEDSLARRLVQFTKLPLTNQLKDGAVGECDAFLNTLLSPNNPAAQRIADYSLDDKSGNTPELEAKGIFVIIARVRTLVTSDFIVVQAQIGEGVNVNVD